MGVEPPQPPADQLDWGPALSWLPVLATDGFEPGRVAGGEEAMPGVFTMPATVLPPEVSEFLACLYDTDIVAPMDWSAWLAEGGRALYDDPDRLATATLEECRMLLIAHVRADRFSEGHLLSVLQDGHLVTVLQRIQALVVTTG